MGFAGRLVDRKGWREFIKAALLLREKPPNETNIKFLIAGIGPRERKLEALIQKFGLGDQIICLGYVENMQWFYSLLNCIVMPSYWEGMPLVQLEAASMRIPLISTDAPGLNEIFTNKEEVIYVKAKNADMIAEKVLDLINDQELQNKLKDHGNKKSSAYTLDRYLINLNRVYH